jgi:hypothetical protein
MPQTSRRDSFLRMSWPGDLPLLTAVTWKPNLRVDVTEEFPFLVTRLSPYYDRETLGIGFLRRIRA